MVNPSLLVRYSFTTFVALFFVYHVAHITMEFLSYPSLVDLLFEDPEQEAIPHFSLCFDLREFISVDKMFTKTPQWSKYIDSVNFNRTVEEIYCFERSEL